MKIEINNFVWVLNNRWNRECMVTYDVSPLLFTRCKNSIREPSYKRSKSHAKLKYHNNDVTHNVQTKCTIYNWSARQRAKCTCGVSARRSWNARVVIALIRRSVRRACNLVNVLKHIPYLLHILVTWWRAIAKNQLIKLETIVIETISAYQEPLTQFARSCTS